MLMKMKDSEYSQRRLAQNELVFRGINNDIDKAENTKLNGNQKALTQIEFVCECSRKTCSDKINISLREYEDIRNEGSLFIIVSGHQVPRIEYIARQEDNFLVVRKTGDAGDEIKKQST